MKPTVITQDTPWGEIPSLLLPAYGETWLMVAIVMLFVVTLGGLVGVVLFNASPRGLFPHALLYRLLNWVVNMGRSLPFLVLMAAIIPFTYWLTGTTIGIPAAVVPMIAAGVPFFGRLVENALRELPAEVTAVGVVCGGSRWQVIASAQLSEAMPALVAAVTLNLVSMIEYSAIAGTIGAGMAQALGAKLLTAEGQQIASGGGALETLARIDLSELDSRLADCRIDVACDVTNPLTGPQGASAVFGPQKGATAQMIDRLDSGLRHYARIIARDLDIDVLSLEGGGAAGGMGAALYAFCGAQLRPGIEIVTDALQLAERVADADLVITGEGRIDSQTIHGKVPVGVARVAKRFNVPVIGIAGSLTADVGVVHQHGLDAVFSVLYTICTLDEALANAAANLRMTARNVAAVLQMGDRR